MKYQKIHYLSEYNKSFNKKKRNRRGQYSKKSNSYFIQKNKNNFGNKLRIRNEKIYRNCYLYVNDGFEIKEGTSYYNIEEVNIIEKILKKLTTYFFYNKKAISIGIFCPYESQSKIIKRKFEDIKVFKIKTRGFYYINEKEKFDIIFISLVRTSYEENALVNNFEKITKIINCSQFLKFILGNIDFISSNNHLRDLYNYLNDKSYVHDFNDNG